MTEDMTLITCGPQETVSIGMYFHLFFLPSSLPETRNVLLPGKSIKNY